MIIMIENLKGIYETVNYKESTKLRLYVNDECEHYPPHWHTPLEIICPIDGNYTVIYKNEAFELRPGDIILICPGTIHELPAYETGVRLIFQADPTILSSIKELDTILSLISPLLLITPESFPQIYADIYRLFIEIKKEYTDGKMLSEGSIYARLIEIIVLLGRNHTLEASSLAAKDTKRQENNEKMLLACQFISDHCTDVPSLEETASYVGFSKYHFDRIFKQFTGISFYRYLNQKRIMLAENMLINPDISITEVALMSGYSSTATFIRMFKILKQCTPSEFRKMHFWNTRKSADGL